MRSAVLFLITILTPCVVLAWVSWGSMREEARNIQEQRTAMYQQSADTAARAAGEYMHGQLRSFGEAVDRLLAGEPVDELRPRFHQAVRTVFPQAAAGMVIETATGRILPQVEPSEQAVTAFVAANDWFFQTGEQPLFVEIPPGETRSTGRHPRLAVQTVPAQKQETATVEQALAELGKEQEAPAPVSAPAAPGSAVPPARGDAPSNRASIDDAQPPPPAHAPVTRSQPALPEDTAAPAVRGGEAMPGEESRRTVLPQHSAPADPGAPSRLKPVPTSLTVLAGRHETGIVSVPRNGELFTLFWYRPPDLPRYTFAVALQPEALKKGLAAWNPLNAPDEDTVLAILDHRLEPAALWAHGADFQPASWGAPLVAREAGAALPRWEAAIFLRDPAVFHNLAAAARWRLGLIVTTASLAAVAGAVFILRDARRTARDARLKTDFVSNVSHELKTPLTSIRMFSDLLGNNPAAPPEKTKRYAEVIAGEAARLTRLINNVLNFSRMEGGREELTTAPVDLRSVVTGTVEHMRPALEKEGFTLDVHLPGQPVIVEGDSDALSQVLMNLLSNAGKYGSAPDCPRHITVALRGGGTGSPSLSVGDRGPGVPRGQERRIFEKFQRAHDALSSGTAGSGLGLTIARRLAEAHGGTLEYTPRSGGGAEFTVTLPPAAARS